jgi:hypothetical protein
MRWLSIVLAASLSSTASAEPPRWMVHANVGMNAFTYQGARDAAPSGWITPDKRVILFQQVGLGYWVHPELRLQLTLQLGETLTRRPSGASALTLFGVIPWVVYTPGRFFTGAGPLVAPRSAGENELDLGVYTAHGVSFPLGRGLAIAGAVQVPIMLKRRFQVAVTPALMLVKRF